ncbi:hypothetical protein D3C81_08360 [compost metagenome]
MRKKIGLSMIALLLILSIGAIVVKFIDRDRGDTVTKSGTDSLIYQAAMLEPNVSRGVVYFIRNVDKNHEWVLEKDTKYTITARDISVVDEEGNAVEVAITIKGDLIKIKAPKDGYNDSLYYSINLPSNFQYSDSDLNKRTKIDFAIKREETEIVKYRDIVKVVKATDFKRLDATKLHLKDTSKIIVGDILLIGEGVNSEAYKVKSIDGDTVEISDIEIYEAIEELKVTKDVQTTISDFTPAKGLKLEMASNMFEQDVYANSQTNTVGTQNEGLLDKLKNVSLKKEKEYLVLKGDLEITEHSTIGVVMKISMPKISLDHDFTMSHGLTRLDLETSFNNSVEVEYELSNEVESLKDKTEEFENYVKRLMLDLPDNASKEEYEMKIGQFDVPIVGAVQVNVPISLYVTVGVEGKLNVQVGVSDNATRGVHYIKGYGFNWYTNGEGAKLSKGELNLSGVVSTEIGTKAGLELSLLKMVSIGGTFKVGLSNELEGKAHIQFTEDKFSNVQANIKVGLHVNAALDVKAGILKYLKNIKGVEGDDSKYTYTIKDYDFMHYFIDITNILMTTEDDSILIKTNTTYNGVIPKENDVSFEYYIKHTDTNTLERIFDLDTIDISTEVNNVILNKRGIRVFDNFKDSKIDIKVKYVEGDKVLQGLKTLNIVSSDYNGQNILEAVSDLYLTNRMYLNSDFTENIIDSKWFEDIAGIRAEGVLNTSLDSWSDDRSEVNKAIYNMIRASHDLYSIPTKGNDVSSFTYLNVAQELSKSKDDPNQHISLNIAWSNDMIGHLQSNLDIVKKSLDTIKKEKEKGVIIYTRDENIALDYINYFLNVFTSNLQHVDNVYNNLKSLSNTSFNEDIISYFKNEDFQGVYKAAIGDIKGNYTSVIGKSKELSEKAIIEDVLWVKNQQ